MLLYPDILNFTFQNVKNSKCKNFLIDFLDELGNFKQKKITVATVLSAAVIVNFEKFFRAI